MSDVTVSLTDSIDLALQSAISDGLGSYNAEMGGARDRKPLAIAINGPDGTPLGGLVGRTSMGLLFIDLFYLPKELRRSGLGSRILTMAEDEARARGCGPACSTPSASRRRSSTSAMAGRFSARSRHAAARPGSS